MDLKKQFYEVLSSYKRLGSPQINSFKDSQISIVCFSFRFLDEEKGSLVYKKLIECVERHSGKLKWILHDKGSRKNYTIEPLKAYDLKLKHGNDYLQHITKEELLMLANESKADIEGLCSALKKCF